MFLIYFLCLAFVGFGWVSGQENVTGTKFTNLTYDLSALINGEYNNSGQVRENKGHVLIQFINRPLLIENLSPRIIWYTELAVNGLVTLAQVSTIEEIGNTVRFNIRQVPKALGLKFKEFDVQQLANYTADDLSAFVPGCVGNYRRLAKASYDGRWSECITRVNGNFISYDDAITCDTVGTVVPPSVSFFNEIPYFFRRIPGSRFPLPQGPDNYDLLCKPKANVLPKCQ